MSANLDLLGPATAPPAPARARPPRSSAFVGGVLVLGALVWAFLLIRPSIFPARRVATAPVRIDAAVATASVVVEATGWVEPDPFPTQVRPLVDGTVERIDVVEGQPVRAGETVVARLRSAMIEGDLEKVRAMVAHKEAHLPEIRAEVAEARAVLAQRLELRREVARLRGALDAASADVEVADADAAVAEARLESARLEADAQASLRGSGSGSEIVRARAEADRQAASAELRSKRAGSARARAALASARRELALAEEADAHPVALEAAVVTKEAHLAAATVEVEAARTERAVAEREAGWLVVTAPIDGVVLRRHAAPGSAVGPSRMARGGEGETMTGGAAEGTLVSLYDPLRLQARVDVPVGSVGSVGAGRRVELSAEALPGRTFRGRVTRILSEADPLKNTLQVKVAIEEPDPLLKPEMLVRARFLAAEPAPGRPSGAARVRVPKGAVREGAVFVVDPTGGGRARRVPVSTGRDDGDLVEVTGDVSATHRVILDVVTDGERVEAAP